MAPRTCPSCGTDVPSGSTVFCPRCGADLEARLIELGSSAATRPRRAARPTRRPGRRRWVLAAAAVALGGVAVASLLADDDGTHDLGETSGSTTAPDVAGTTVADLSDQAPLLGEDVGLHVAAFGQASVAVGLDDGSVEFLNPFGNDSGQFRAVDAFGSQVVVVSDLGVHLWTTPFVDRDVTLLDELAVADAFAGDTVVWSLDPTGTRVRALRVPEPSGLLLDQELPSGGEVVGVVGDSLVLGAPGGTYVLEPDGTSHALSGGAPIAVGRSLVAVSVCDDDLVCGVQTLDLDGVVLQTLPLRGGLPVVAAALGPDGRLAWIAGEPGEGSLVIDGRVAFPIPATGAAAVAWSPDGRWLAGSFARRNLWFLDTEGGPDAEPVIVDLGQNVYPTEILFLEG